jgi:hypothetical protein
MNLDFIDMITKPLGIQMGQAKLKIDDSKELLYKSMYMLEAIINENPNTNNMNGIKMLYQNIKDFLVNNK